MTEREPSTVAIARTPALSDTPDHEVLCLTIAWHPDPSRVGISAPLEGNPVAVSRRTAPFDLSRDITLSRSPFLHIHPSSTGVEIVAVPGTTPLLVQGHSLEAPLRLVPQQLREGVMLTLGTHVAVCLHLGAATRRPGPDRGLVGVSDAIEAVRRQIARVAGSGTTVLIRGETGTGKEVVARALQAASGRAAASFVCVNMAAIASSTAVDELFGHERGAFTGATEGRLGYFGEADGGTLFLDEIGAAPLEIQRMLLRVLETGEIRSLGAKRTRRVDVRLLAATDEDLETAVRAGRFSEPLLHRLASCEIRLPPLRARRADVGPFLLHFLRQELQAMGRPELLAPRQPPEQAWLGAEAVAEIASGALLGNVRGLRNLARQIVLSNGDRPVADVRDLLRPALTVKPSVQEPPPLPAPEPPMRITDQQIQEALRRHHYNIAGAARFLGLHRTTLHERIRQNPGDVRQASQLSDDEVIAADEKHAGDVVAMAGELRVSPKPLKARMRGLRQNRGMRSLGTGPLKGS